MICPCTPIKGMPDIHQAGCQKLPPGLVPGPFVRPADATWYVYRHGGRSADYWRERYAGPRHEAEPRYRALRERIRQGGVALVMERQGYRVLMDSTWAPRLGSRWGVAGAVLARAGKWVALAVWLVCVPPDFILRWRLSVRRRVRNPPEDASTVAQG